MSVQNNGLSDEIDVSESTIVVSLYSIDSLYIPVFGHNPRSYL